MTRCSAKLTTAKTKKRRRTDERIPHLLKVVLILHFFQLVFETLQGTLTRNLDQIPIMKNNKIDIAATITTIKVEIVVNLLIMIYPLSLSHPVE